MAAQDRAREIDRTKTGLLLILIGVLLTPVPYVAFVGDILLLVGAILVIVGRKAFGQAHARNTIWSIIIFVVGFGVVITGIVVFTVAVVSAGISSSVGGTFNATTLGQSLSSSFDILLVFSAVGGAISGIAEVLFTYAIQNEPGRILLWTGYAAALAVSSITFILISPLVANAASQSFNGTTYNPAPFTNLQSQLQTIGLLNFIPAIIYATAIYLAWARVNRGEIPGQISQPTTMNP
jgi:hypothetical protein